MKKLSVLLLLSVTMVHLLNAQVKTDSLSSPRPNPSALSEKYLLKGKSLETTGFVLMGAGIAATIGGAIGFTQNFNLLAGGAGDGYAVLFLAGIASTITSIPLIITGIHYKHKAKLVVHGSPVSRNLPMPVKGNAIAVGFSIAL